MGDYPNIDDANRRSVLQPQLQQRLAAFYRPELLKSPEAFEALINAVNNDLHQLPANALPQASVQIRSQAWLWVRDCDLFDLGACPALKYLFLFHTNGYLREAALNLIDGADASVFMVSAVAHQANDWVPEVRRAAVEALKRLVPVTSVEVLAEAALYLMVARHAWQRGAEDLAVLDDILVREDVLSRVIEHVIGMKDGSPHRILLAAARYHHVDMHLLRLFRHAAHPAVRTIAAQALMRKEIRWAVGREKRWVDKSMGKFVWANRFASRALTLNMSANVLVVELAANRLPQIRKIAMQAIIDDPPLWRDREHLIHRLSTDRSAVIRAGMDFIRRQQAKESLDPAGS